MLGFHDVVSLTLAPFRNQAFLVLRMECLARNPASLKNTVERTQRQLFASVIRYDNLMTSLRIAPRLMATPLGDQTEAITSEDRGDLISS